MLHATLIKKAADYVAASPWQPGSLVISRLAGEAKKTVPTFLASLDVRSIGHLRNLVPGAFPKKLRKGQLVAQQNIHGKWKVEVSNG